MSEEKCKGLYKAVELIGSKWVLLILYNLCTERKGFNELQRALPRISPRILSLRLKELVESGLVTKTVFQTTPPTVQYSITPKGQSLKSILESLGSWADTI